MTTPEVDARRRDHIKQADKERSSTTATLWSRFLALVESEKAFGADKRNTLRRTKSEFAQQNYMRWSIAHGIPAGWWWETAYEADLLGVEADVTLKPAGRLESPPGTRQRLEELRRRYHEGEELMPEDEYRPREDRSDVVNTTQFRRRWEPGAI